MRVYEKSFVNPLLALAFIDGILYTMDPDIFCEKPKRKSDDEWIVMVSDNNQDDDVDENYDEILVNSVKNKNNEDDEKEIISAVEVNNNEEDMAPREIRLEPKLSTANAEWAHDINEFVGSGKCEKCKDGNFGICNDCGSINEPNDLMNVLSQ